MVKLEEISEILVSEIRDFEEAVKKLEEIQKTKITIDLAELKQVLSNHEVEIKHEIIAVQETFKQLEILIKGAKIYYKWAVIAFIVFFVINCIVLIIFFYFILN